jgi:hypothetical protein
MTSFVSGMLLSLVSLLQQDSSNAVQSQSVAKCGNPTHLTSLVSDLARKRARTGRNGRFLAPSMHRAGHFWATAVSALVASVTCRYQGPAAPRGVSVSIHSHMPCPLRHRGNASWGANSQVWLRAYAPRPYLRAISPCIINPTPPSRSVGRLQQPTLIEDWLLLWTALWTSIHHFSQRRIRVCLASFASPVQDPPSESLKVVAAEGLAGVLVSCTDASSNKLPSALHLRLISTTRCDHTDCLGPPISNTKRDLLHCSRTASASKLIRLLQRWSDPRVARRCIRSPTHRPRDLPFHSFRLLHSTASRTHAELL